MKVYKISADGTGEWARFSTTNGEKLGVFGGATPFDGRRQSIQIVRLEDSKASKLPDFSCVNHTPYLCFSQRAKDKLASYIDSLGKWLRLDFENSFYWLYDIEKTIPALNEKKSRILYFDEKRSKVQRIAEFDFFPEKIRGELIFKPVQIQYNLATSNFLDLVRRYQLTGFEFKLLWSSDGGPVSSEIKDYERPRTTGLELDEDER